MGGLNLRILSLFRKARNFQGEAIHIHNYIHQLLIPQIGEVVPFVHKVQHAELGGLTDVGTTWKL